MLTGVAIFVAPSIISQFAMAMVTLIAAFVIFDIPGLISADTSVLALLDYWIYGVLACLFVAAVIALLSMGRERQADSLFSRLFLSSVILATALVAAVALVIYSADNWPSRAINFFVAASLVISAVIALIALTRGGLPASAGAPPDERRLRQPIVGISAEWLTYLAAMLAVPILALLVSGFAPFNQGDALTIIPEQVIERIGERGRIGAIFAVFLHETSKPAGLVLFLSGIGALLYLGMHTIELDRIPRQRMYVVFILTFFSMFFWSFFEQAGSSLNNFADRNVNRVVGATRRIESENIGSIIEFQPTQRQLGYSNGGRAFTMDQLAALRAANQDNPNFAIEWTVSPDNVGMIIAERDHEIPASWFQSVNAFFILVFGLVFTALWGYLGQRGIEPGTPYKFALGLLQLGLGFGAFWYGAQTASDRGMVALGWLFVGYLLHTTGELCLSPVGLSMVSKLSPTYLVSTVMGMWFLATAFSQFLAAIIAQFTRVQDVAENATGVPAPSETLHLYGGVFGNIAITAIISAAICFLLSPLLTKWMHAGEEESFSPELSGPPPTKV
jgi:POT family proton-dependent oligopeptide transporter